MRCWQSSLSLAREVQVTLEEQLSVLQRRPAMHVVESQWNALASQLDAEVKRCEELQHQVSFYEDTARQTHEQLLECQAALKSERHAATTVSHQREELQVRAIDACNNHRSVEVVAPRFLRMQ